MAAKLGIVAILALLPATSEARWQVEVHGSSCATDVVRSAITPFAALRNVPGELFFIPRPDDVVAESLQKRECEVGVTMDCMCPKIRKQLGPEYEPLPIGRLATAVIVHAKSPVHKLTFLQVNRIFRGRITSWEGIAGTSNAPIQLYCPILAMNEAVLFHHKVLQGSSFSTVLDNPAKMSSHQKLAVEEVVRAVALDEKAIAFVPFRPKDTPDKRVRIVAIAMDERQEAVLPSQESIADGTYYIADSLQFYVHPQAPPLALEFCRYATGPDGVKTAKDCGIWPEYELRKVRGNLRLKEMQAGKGKPMRICGLKAWQGLASGLAVEYVKAKALIQPKYEARPTAEDARKAFEEGGEVLLAVGLQPSPPASLPQAGEGRNDALLGHRAVGVIVHRDNKAKELNLDDLKQIYLGQVQDWPAASGRGLKMKLFGLPPENVAMKVLDAVVPGRHAAITRRADTAKVILSMVNEPGAIGFVDLAEMPKDTSVKLLAILPKGAKEAAVPSAEKLPADYPLAQPISLSLHAKASEAAKDFVAYVTKHEPEVQEVLRAQGIIPAPPPPPAEPTRKPIEVAKADALPPVAIGEPREKPKDKLEEKPQEGTDAKKAEPVQEKPQETPKPAPKPDAPEDISVTDPRVLWAGGILLGVGVLAFVLMAVGRRR